LCAVFDHVRDFSPQEKALISLAASVVGSEETRRQSEKALSSAREKHNAIFEAALDHIYTKDKDFCYTSLNPAGEEFLGVKESQILGKDDSHFFVPQSVSYIHEMDRKVLEGEIINQKKPLIDLSGHKRDFHVIKVPLKGQDGQVTGICGIARDVTHTKMMEKQQMQVGKMQALGALAGGLAHDFNNILAVIMGYTELALENAEEGTENQEELEVVLKATERAKSLVRQIMTFSSTVRLEPVIMDLNHEVKQTCLMLADTLPGNIHFDLDLGAHLGRMKGDPAKLGQVLLNLSLNAADAMPQGGVIHIKTSTTLLPLESRPETLDLKPGCYLSLSVRDNGCGMDEKTVERIFEPFFTTKNLGHGMGLGLSTAFGIVKSHGGRILCRSAPGEGSEFTLYFPIISPVLSPQGEISEPTSSPGGNELILVVDDEASVRHLARTILERHGYSVLGASNGEKALSLFAENHSKIDLVIMDLGMPGMSGTQCLERLLALKPDLKFMVASGYARKQDANGMAKLGKVPFLAKPFTVRGLLHEVRQVLEKTQK
jgi:PAS domain S-box-containing protein